MFKSEKHNFCNLYLKISVILTFIWQMQLQVKSIAQWTKGEITLGFEPSEHRYRVLYWAIQWENLPKWFWINTPAELLQGPEPITSQHRERWRLKTTTHYVKAVRPHQGPALSAVPLRKVLNLNCSNGISCWIYGGKVIRCSCYKAAPINLPHLLLQFYHMPYWIKCSLCTVLYFYFTLQKIYIF